MCIRDRHEGLFVVAVFVQQVHVQLGRIDPGADLIVEADAGMHLADHAADLPADQDFGAAPGMEGGIVLLLDEIVILDVQRLQPRFDGALDGEEVRLLAEGGQTQVQGCLLYTSRCV